MPMKNRLKRIFGLAVVGTGLMLPVAANAQFGDLGTDIASPASPFSPSNPMYGSMRGDSGGDNGGVNTLWEDTGLLVYNVLANPHTTRDQLMDARAGRNVAYRTLDGKTYAQTYTSALSFTSARNELFGDMSCTGNLSHKEVDKLAARMDKKEDQMLLIAAIAFVLGATGFYWGLGKWLDYSIRKERREKAARENRLSPTGPK
jgi:hypothetical protein